MFQQPALEGRLQQRDPDGRGLLHRFLLKPGQASDQAAGCPLIDGHRPVSDIATDRAHDAQSILDLHGTHDYRPHISPQRGCEDLRSYESTQSIISIGRMYSLGAPLNSRTLRP